MMNLTFWMALVFGGSVFAQDEHEHGTAHQAKTRKTADPMIVCPVGDTGLPKSKATGLVYKGKTYYLCCKMCVDSFYENPEKYIKRAAQYADSGSSWLLNVEDLRNPDSLAYKLGHAHDPLSRYLKEHFSPRTQQRLAEYDGSRPPSAGLRTAIVDELNQLLQGPSLFREERFRGIRLTGEIQRLIEQELQGESLIRLNRLLLEAAYPDEIARHRAISLDDGNRTRSAPGEHPNHDEDSDHSEHSDHNGNSGGCGHSGC